MSKFNMKSAAPLRTYGNTTINEVVDGSVTTYEGAPGTVRDEKSELFLLAVSDFVEDTFYESANDRSDRLAQLSAKVAVKDPQWFESFITWLRGTANMRSVAIASSLEGVKAMVGAGIPHGKYIVNAALQRADEPGEALSYWLGRHGRKIPQPIKRGISMAANRLYNEYSVFKYDTPSHAVRFADVIQLTHAKPDTPVKSDLFKYILDRRYNKDAEIPESLTKATSRKEIKQLSGTDLRSLANKGELTPVLRESGMTWEALSSVISGGMDKKAWEAVIPLMGYMALLRNIRNFLEAGVSSEILKKVAAKLSDPEEVAKSRQLPFRFWSAYRQVQHNTMFAHALEEALNASIKNVPFLTGNTLIMVDNSGSMGIPLSGNSSVTMSEVAKLFGSALAIRAEKSTLIEFKGRSFWGSDEPYTEIKVPAGSSLLPTIKKFSPAGGGTDIESALTKFFNTKYDRVIIISDEQASYEGDRPYTDIPQNIPVFVWNLAGYSRGYAPMGVDMSLTNVFKSGGFSDNSFNYIKLIESGIDNSWPWE